jgi:DNA-binding transcriptional regulator LsrR (DeoR family)
MHRTDNLSLAAEVARLYYLEHKTQTEISRIVKRSRSTVARLLKLARDDGLVDIYVRDVKDPEEKAKQLAQSLCNMFESLNKDYTRVLYTHSVGEVLSERLGKLASEVLEEIIFVVHRKKYSNPNVSSRVRLGVGFGAQLRYVIDFSYPQQICEDIVAVPLIGGFGRGEEMQRNDSNELSRRIAKHYGGTWEQLLCPAKVGSFEAKRNLEKEEVISRVMREARNCDIYLVGAGGMRADTSADSPLTQIARTRGAVGTICAQMYTVDGEGCLRPERSGAIMGISLDDLRKSAGNDSYVFAVAGGESRHRAVLGALRTGCINCIVTDQRCAEWVIEQQEMRETQ